MKVWFYICGWLVSALTALGNGFIVVFVAKTRCLHSQSNWFVLSLAVADFGVGVIIFPFSYASLRYPTAGTTFSKWIYITAYWFLVHSSVANLCILTWDRYTAIVHPLRYITSIIMRRAGKIILFAWLIPLLISLFLFLGMFTGSSPTVSKVLRLTGVSGFDILCSSLLVYAVVRILVVARSQSLQNSAMESLRKELHTRVLFTTPFRPIRHKHSSARFIIAIVVLFLACNVVKNYLILRIMFVSDVSDNVSLVVTVLLVANSAANPLVYACLKRDIKRELRRLICRRDSIETTV